jgi:hypothetical protein
LQYSNIFWFQKLKEFLADAQAEGRSLALLYSSAVCLDYQDISILLHALRF